MANVPFVVALVLFHLALFTSFALYARALRAGGHAALAVALAFLSYVAWDLARDPAPARLAGLSMGLFFMFTLLWTLAGFLFVRVALAGGHVSDATAWLLRRASYWTTSGALGSLAFGALFPRLRGYGGALDGLAGYAALALAVLAAASALLLVRLRVRPALGGLRDARDPAGRAASAREAARFAFVSLAVGLAAVGLAALSGAP